MELPQSVDLLLAHSKSLVVNLYQLQNTLTELTFEQKEESTGEYMKDGIMLATLHHYCGTTHCPG